MTLHVEVHGQTEPGAPSVLLASGLGGSAGFWAPQIPALVEAGWRVVAYDQRGTGRSPATLDTSHDIAAMARDVLQVMDATATPRAHVVGHALGGLIGLQLALDAPDRVASLGLINAWSRPNPHSARCFDARLALLDACGPAAYCAAQPIFLYPADWAAAHAELIDAEVAHALAHFPGAANVKARIAALRAFDIDAQLSRITVPTLVACARDDVLVPWTRSLRLFEGLQNSTLACSEHGGHAHSVTGAAAFNTKLLSFLAEQR